MRIPEGFEDPVLARSTRLVRFDRGMSNRVEDDLILPFVDRSHLTPVPDVSRKLK